VDVVVRDVLEVAAHRDWDSLRLMLHPYLHWTPADGETVRGRNNVLSLLTNSPPPQAPASVELRALQPPAPPQR
jgi:hypothetical protein